MRLLDRIFPALLAAILAGHLSACESDVIPFLRTDRFDGYYALHAVDGAPIPTTVTHPSGRGTYIILADTLRFSTNGTVARSFTFRHLNATFSPPDSIYRYEVLHSYELERGKLTINPPPCPINANCVDVSAQGMVSRHRVILVGKAFWPGDPVLTFLRTDAP